MKKEVATAQDVHEWLHLDSYTTYLFTSGQGKSSVIISGWTDGVLVEPG